MAESVTNERQVKKKREQQRRDRLTDEIVTKQLMATPDGRRWVWMRLTEAAIFSGNENLDPQYMAWEKGNRNAGLRLLDDVTKFTPQQYITMTEEARSVKLQQVEPEPEEQEDE